MRSGSIEPDWLDQDGYDTRGPNNVKLLPSSQDSTSSRLSRNASDETAIYVMNQAPSEDDMVSYNETRETSGDTLPDKYCHVPTNNQIKMSQSDSSVATLPLSVSMRSSGSKPPQAPYSPQRRPSFNSVTSYGSAASQGSRKARKDYYNSLGENSSYKSGTSANRSIRGDTEGKITQKDSMSVCSHQSGSVSHLSTAIDQLAAVAITAAVSVLAIGGKKEAAKAAATAVLCSETKKSQAFDEWIPVAVDAAIAVLEADMSQNSAVAVLITILRNAEIRAAEDASVASSTVPGQNDSEKVLTKPTNFSNAVPPAINTPTNCITATPYNDSEKVLAKPANFSNIVPPNIVTTTNSIIDEPHYSPEAREIGCHTYDPEEVCQGCSYDPIVTKIGGAIENLHDKVLTPTSKNIEKGVTEMWKGLEASLVSFFDKEDEITPLEEAPSSCQEENTKKVARSTEIRVGSYDICVAESADDIEVNVTASHPHSNASGEKLKKKTALYRAKRKVGKKIGKLVGTRRLSRQNSESSAQ